MSTSKLRTLIRRKMWFEALELAVAEHPEEVAELLELGGNSFYAHSKDEELFDLLEKLPESFKTNSHVLFWRFRTSRRINKHTNLIPMVEKTLEKHEAPELRVLFATMYFSDSKKLLEEAEHALKIKPVPFIQHYYAIALAQDSPNRAIEYQAGIIEELELRSDNFWLIHFLSNQGTFYEYQGDLIKGLEYFKKALDRLDQVFFSHWGIKIHLIRNYIVTALKIGAFDDIPQSYIETLEDELELLSMEKTLITRNTLGLYFTFAKQFDRAKDIFEDLFKQYQTEEAFITNFETPDMAYNYVRSLLLTEEFDKAKEIASSVLNENKSQARYDLANQLAYALVIIHSNPNKVIELLAKDSDKWSKEIMLQDLRVPAFTLLSYAYLQVGNIESASKLLGSENFGDFHIDGFRMIMGSDKFDEVYHFWKGNDLAPLLSDFKAFDELFTNEASWNRLALLENADGHLEQCRYTQYLLSVNDIDKALSVSREVFKAWPCPLSQGIFMSALNAVGGIKALTELDNLIQNMPENSGSPLDTEGKMYIYEATALYYLRHRNDPKLAQRYLYWEEAIAHEHSLNYRLSVIASLLDEVDSGSSVASKPVTPSITNTSNDSLIRERFQTILTNGDTDKARVLVNEQLISSQESNLVQALSDYRIALESIDEKGLFSKAARLLSPQLPDEPESRFFWALLMLQLHSKVGSFDNNSDSKFILSVLNEAIDDINPDKDILKFAARTFPLGLSIAAHLTDKLSDALEHVAIILHDDKRDGIRIADAKLANLPPPVREAIILDGIHADNREFQAIISSKTGHTMNKKRFDQALEKAVLQPHELTDIGSVFRGINEIAKSGHKDAELALQSVLSQRPYLKDFVDEFSL